jgi:hypothetical protein
MVFIRSLLVLVIALILLLALVGPLRSLILGAMVMVPRGRRASSPQRQDVEIPVTAFTLTTAGGQSVEVVLRGELRGGALHLGDSVEVWGRAVRAGWVQAKAVVNTVSGARTTTRQHPALTRSRIETIGGAIAVVFLGLVLLSLFQSCGPIQ